MMVPDRNTISDEDRDMWDLRMFNHRVHKGNRQNKMILRQPKKAKIAFVVKS